MRVKDQQNEFPSKGKWDFLMTAKETLGQFGI